MQIFNFINEVEVPDHWCPFQDPHQLDTFKRLWNIVKANGELPRNYGIQEEEWEDGQYPISEWVKYGKRVGKDIEVELPVFIWKLQAELWCKAIDLLSVYQMELGNDT